MFLKNKTTVNHQESLSSTKRREAFFVAIEDKIIISNNFITILKIKKNERELSF